MTRAHEAGFDSNTDGPDYTQQLADLLIEFPQAELTPKTQTFILAGFHEMDKKYGMRPYHDGQHPFKVLRRGLEWLEEFGRFSGVELTADDYEALAISSAYHDIILVNESEDENEQWKSPERLSAEHTQALMFYLDYEPTQADRVYNSILATEVEYSGKEVLQTMATKTRPDVVTAALLMADIGNVTYQDEMVMVQDISEVSAEELYKIDEGITILKDNETLLGKVMAIFDKQALFRDQRFLDLPRMLEYHLGEAATALFLNEHFEQLAIQSAKIDDLIDRIKARRTHLIEVFTPIVLDKNMSAKDKADAIRRQTMDILDPRKW